MQCLKQLQNKPLPTKKKNMNTLIILLLLFFLFLILVSFAKQKPPPLFDFEPAPYISSKPLTKTETIFYHRLVEALPDHVVLAQVQLSRFIDVDKSQIIENEFYKWFNPISQQSVDYLICTKEFSIVTAIELDDKTHNTAKAIDRDDKKNKNLAAAKIPLIRWHAEAMPELEEIKLRISNYLPNTQNSPPTNNDWTFEPQPQHFSPSKKTLSFPIALLLSAVFMLTLLWVIHQLSNSVSKTFPKYEQTNINKQSYETQKQSQKRIKKQEEDRKALEALKKQQLIAQQQAVREQNLRHAEALQEESIKETIWNQNFKQKVECTHTDDMVKCGNDYIQNRKKFEAYWEANKSSFLNNN